VLEFRTGSSACQPVIEALALIRRHAAAGSLTYYPAGEHVPAHAGITEDWKPLVYRTDQHGRQRVVRMAYEVVTFQALREHLRCKEIWIIGAGRWRNPDEDLPADFEINFDLKPATTSADSSTNISFGANTLGNGMDGSTVLVSQWTDAGQPTQAQCANWVLTHSTHVVNNVAEGMQICIRTVQGRIGRLTLASISPDQSTLNVMAVIWN
jgi:hypothetical protein